MIKKLITERRAVFPVQYNDTPILRETIESLLEAANWAPTHKRTEPWRFKVFHSLEARTALANYMEATYPNNVQQFSEFKMRKLVEKPIQAGCVIAICFQRDPKESLPEWEEIAATAMAVQNMWLLATELGLGAYWSSPALLKDFGTYFPLNPGERCLGFFYIGNHDGPLEAGKRQTGIEAKTQWI